MFRSLFLRGRVALLVLAIVLASLAVGRPAAAFESYIYGTAYDANTLQVLPDVCVVLGPALLTCIARTDVNGKYFIKFLDDDLIKSEQELHFLYRSQGYQDYDTQHFVVKGATFQPAAMLRVGAVRPQGCDTAGIPTRSIYLPNITRYLGGPNGWYTPFIVQNTGAAPTTLEVSFYKFTDGSLITCRKISNLLPGTSFADVPTNDLDLPFDSQFAVVIRSFGSTIVSVVNEHIGAGARAEAMSYVGASAGALSVFLPNITRRFFGFDTPLIIQNLGTAQTTATARFVSFDGTAPTISAIRTIDVGRSQFIDPNYEPGLVDGHQYAVTVTASQPISIVVNTQDDQPGVQYPKAYSTIGLVAGGPTLFGAYASKNAAGIGRSTTIVVQNMGSAGADPQITLTPLGGGVARNFALGAVQSGGSRVFDLRYANGDTLQPFCGSIVSATCLADGEYSFTASAPGGSLAAVVNVISTATAMGYAATASTAARVYFPNVTRTLGGVAGWTTPLVVQSEGATAVRLSWYRFIDGALVTTQSIDVAPGSAFRVDPRDVSGLADGTQYSVVADAIGGSITGIVIELAGGGDNAMIYEGFTSP